MFHVICEGKRYRLVVSRQELLPKPVEMLFDNVVLMPELEYLILFELIYGNSIMRSTFEITRKMPVFM